jgi:hypothetical protein
MRYDDDPRKFEVTILDLLRKYAPAIYDRVNLNEFGVTRSEDVLQGAITPTVRKGYSALGNGKFAIALGDIHMLQDPVIAQGANMASRCAWVLGEALLQDSAVDEAFCHNMEQRLWEAGRAATEWTNMTLQPPPPYGHGVVRCSRAQPGCCGRVGRQLQCAGTQQANLQQSRMCMGILEEAHHAFQCREVINPTGEVPAYFPTMF